jgi:hypothetical protein
MWALERRSDAQWPSGDRGQSVLGAIARTPYCAGQLHKWKLLTQAGPVPLKASSPENSPHNTQIANHPGGALQKHVALLTSPRPYTCDRRSPAARSTNFSCHGRCSHS